MFFVRLWQAWQERRHRARLAPVAAWRREVLETLLGRLIRPEHPYILDGAFSWLQPGPLALDAPERLTLFFPEYPLAIDLLGPDQDEAWERAAPYARDRASWEADQERQRFRTARLRQVGCPYLVLRYSEPCGAAALRERLEAFTRRRA